MLIAEFGASGLLPPLVLLAALLTLAPGGARGDAIDDDGASPHRDRRLEHMRRLDRIAPFEDPAPLWDHVDPALESEVRQALDDLRIDCDPGRVDASHLSTAEGSVVSEQLHSHLLRSICPVTAQPDTGSILVDYEGPEIDRPGLMRYIVSFRQHADFHEACVERMFVDILAKCSPTKLTVYARFQRRGGIDINPCRSNTAGRAENLRLWRQ